MQLPVAGRRQDSRLLRSMLATQLFRYAYFDERLKATTRQNKHGGLEIRTRKQRTHGCKTGKQDL